jgi:hypothetical protein
MDTLSNRDYIYRTKEMGHKLIFLGVFYRPNLYLIESEPEIAKGYADLLYIVRDDKRKRSLLDFILEFKYIALKDIGKSTEELKKIPKKELLENPLVKTKISEAKEQLLRYEKGLNAKHPHIKFRKYIIIGIGFVRILGIEI